MGRSLVLNASYEPLGTVAARRAVVLVLAEKADCLHPSGLVLHAERMQIDVPSVVRLRQFVHVPFRRRVAVSRRAVMARDGHRCQYCGAHADSIDHVTPRSKGGQHVWDNVVAACRACNVRKRDRLLHESGMRLRRAPAVPHGIIWSIVAGGGIPEDWVPYLGERSLAAAPAAAG
jgi:5-methylcytosine-specific restriction endonuclease McrA